MTRPVELKSLEHQQALRGARAMGLFCFIVCAGLVIMAFAPARLNLSRPFGLAVAGLAALVLLGIALRHGWHALRYAGVRLVLDKAPAVGEPFTARLVLPARLHPGGEARVEWICRGLQWGSAPGAEAQEVLLWRKELAAPVVDSPEGPGATFALDVPANQPASDLPPYAAWSRELGSRTRDASVRPDQRHHEWQLVVHAAHPGLALRRTCIVQVRPPLQQRLLQTAGRREFESRNT